MTRSLRTAGALAIAAALCAVALSCGGGAGQNAIVGLGNSGNLMSGADEVAMSIARALARIETTPAVSDEAVGEIFEAILTRARDGNSEAALIMLSLAQTQREPEEE